jgi:membrane protease YdiL (CAAX protease family)
MNPWNATRGLGAALVIMVLSRGMNEAMRLALGSNAAFADWLSAHSHLAEFGFNVFKFCVWIFVAYLFAGRPKTGALISETGFSKRVTIIGWLCAWGAIGIGFLSLWFVQKGWANENLPAKKHSQGAEAVWLGFLVQTILLSPFVEELVARGFLYRAFRGSFGWGPSTALVLAFQAYFHWGLLSQNMTGFGFVLAFGTVLCAIRERTGNTWNCVLFHVVYNATVLQQWPLAVIAMVILMPFCDRGVRANNSPEIHNPSSENA